MLIRSFTVIALLAGTLMPVGAKDQSSGFDGKWTLDKHAQNTGTPPPPADLKQQLKLHGTDLVIQSQFAEPPDGIAPLLYLGIMTSALQLRADGAEGETQVGPYMFASKTTINGNTMETEWHSVYKGDPVQGHWTRTIADDGKHMTLQIKESSTQGQSGEALLHFTRK